MPPPRRESSPGTPVGRRRITTLLPLIGVFPQGSERLPRSPKPSREVVRSEARRSTKSADRRRHSKVLGSLSGLRRTSAQPGPGEAESEVRRGSEHHRVRGETMTWPAASCVCRARRQRAHRRGARARATTAGQRSRSMWRPTQRRRCVQRPCPGLAQSFRVASTPSVLARSGWSADADGDCDQALPFERHAIERVSANLLDSSRPS